VIDEAEAATQRGLTASRTLKDQGHPQRSSPFCIVSRVPAVHYAQTGDRPRRRINGSKPACLICLMEHCPADHSR
jgi:hypothetical protein